MNKPAIFLLLLVVSMAVIGGCAKTEPTDDTTETPAEETEDTITEEDVEDIDETQYDYDDVDVDFGDVV